MKEIDAIIIKRLSEKMNKRKKYSARTGEELEQDQFESKNMAEHISSNLWEKKIYADCVLVTADGTEIKAHKCMLARSPVFAAMFAHGTIEAKKNRVNIVDITADVLNQILRFIYTDAVTVLRGNAEQLLVAADKYQLSGFKLKWEHSLALSIGIENVCDLLILAQTHSATVLKSKAMDFIKRHINEVMESAGWNRLYTKHAELVKQIMKFVATNTANCSQPKTRGLYYWPTERERIDQKWAEKIKKYMNEGE